MRRNTIQNVAGYVALTLAGETFHHAVRTDCGDDAADVVIRPACASGALPFTIPREHVPHRDFETHTRGGIPWIVSGWSNAATSTGLAVATEPSSKVRIL